VLSPKERISPQFAPKAGRKWIRKVCDFDPFSGRFSSFLALFCTKNGSFRAFLLWKSFDAILVSCFI